MKVFIIRKRGENWYVTAHSMDRAVARWRKKYQGLYNDMSSPCDPEEVKVDLCGKVLTEKESE